MSIICNFFVSINIHEASGGINWKLAVKEEMDALNKNNTLSITGLLKDNEVTGCK